MPISPSRNPTGIWICSSDIKVKLNVNFPNRDVESYYPIKPGYRVHPYLTWSSKSWIILIIFIQHLFGQNAVMHPYVCSYSFWFSYCQQKYSFQGSGKFLTFCGMMSSHMYVAHRLTSWPWTAPYIQALLEKWPLSSLHPGLGDCHLFSLWYLNYRAYQWDSCWDGCQASSGRGHWKASCLARNPRSCWIFAAILCQNEVDMRNLLFGGDGSKCGYSKNSKEKQVFVFSHFFPWRLSTALPQHV